MYIDRELQLYDGDHATCNLGEYGFTIDEPHILFDVNLDAALEGFLSILDEYYAPEAVRQNYQNADGDSSVDPFFVFEQAIDEVLGLDATYHNGATDIAAENVGGMNPATFDDWEALAATWLGQYLTAYNAMRRERAPAALDELRTALETLHRGDQLTAKELLTIVKYDLGMNPHEGRF